jgi:hypothetical protein
MVTKRKDLIFLLVAYIVIFWIGYRTGEINTRLKRTVTAPKVTPDNFYMVEDIDYGTYRRTEFYEISGTNLIMRFFYDPKLRPLLKTRNIKLYKSNGERIY